MRQEAREGLDTRGEALEKGDPRGTTTIASSPLARTRDRPSVAAWTTDASSSSSPFVPSHHPPPRLSNSLPALTGPARYAPVRVSGLGLLMTTTTASSRMRELATAHLSQQPPPSLRQPANQPHRPPSSYDRRRLCQSPSTGVGPPPPTNSPNRPTPRRGSRPRTNGAISHGVCCHPPLSPTLRTTAPSSQPTSLMGYEMGWPFREIGIALAAPAPAVPGSAPESVTRRWCRVGSTLCFRGVSTTTTNWRVERQGQAIVTSPADARSITSTFAVLTLSTINRELQRR
ncbi:hypothetical protein GALMADRAFT_137531 [Galerina marginata CBS 339.88]|uniref:Uncharacterized protein n=1 Tax=Galerina marginata (strain CBS 339.88) TaxID=685588 RepID=A0A067THP1_GALM3|nr:hypothetical protein GALMADRAFT_137531 [Galerina marginata CBS 339.88]